MSRRLRGSVSQSEKMTAEMAKALDTFDCGICLQRCEHPARLPCDHVFCYLCIKGIANRSGTCAYCRRPIPAEFLDNPQILNGESFRPQDSSPERFAWFYQAKTSGWWQYQQRDSDELEAVYQQDREAVFDRLIAGYVYVINFKDMIQHRKTDRTVYRRIKRDIISIGDRVGVAGLRLPAAGLRCDDCSASGTQSKVDDNAACALEASTAGPCGSSSNDALVEPNKLQQPSNFREPGIREQSLCLLPGDVAQSGRSRPSESSPALPVSPQESDNAGQHSSVVTDQPAYTRASRRAEIEEAAAPRDEQFRSTSARQRSRQRSHRSEDADVNVLVAALSMSDDRAHDYV